MPDRIGADYLTTWLYRLIHSEEWALLQQAFVASMVQRAIEGQWSSDRVAEFARDRQGLGAFVLWCSNEVSRKAGQIDGRAKRYKQRRGGQRNGQREASTQAEIEGTVGSFGGGNQPE